MRVAITNPTTWPWVARGGERFLNELAAYLAARGHEVTVLSGKPGPTEVRRERGYTSVCRRRLWHPALAKIGLLEFHAFFPVLLPQLLRRRYDVVFCCTFLDTYAAVLARHWTGTPCIFWGNSTPPPVQYFRSLTLGGALIRRAMRDADEVVSLSRYMHTVLERRFGRGGTVLPVPVEIEKFPLVTGRDYARPMILCAAALDDQRKGGAVLMRAFDRLKQSRPELRLRLAGPAGPAARERLLGLVSPPWRADVEFQLASTAELHRVYAQAAVSVLPSLWEAFGLVVVESMACGTPVVGTRDGALPELINSPRVGRLFDPDDRGGAEATNVDGLAQAIRETLELSQHPDTALHCRSCAQQVSWAQVGPQFEDLLLRVAARQGGAFAMAGAP